MVDLYASSCEFYSEEIADLRKEKIGGRDSLKYAEAMAKFGHELS